MKLKAADQNTGAYLYDYQQLVSKTYVPCCHKTGRSQEPLQINGWAVSEATNLSFLNMWLVLDVVVLSCLKLSAENTYHSEMSPLLYAFSFIPIASLLVDIALMCPLSVPSIVNVPLQLLVYESLPMNPICRACMFIVNVIQAYHALCRQCRDGLQHLLPGSS